MINLNITEEEMQGLIRLRNLGAAMETISEKYDIGNAITVASAALLLPIVKELAQALTDNDEV